jgi:hypothetical protein
MEHAKIGEQVAYHSHKHRRTPNLPVFQGQWGFAYTPLGIRVLHGGGPKPLYVRRRGGG